jgi:LuxR family transcriptional regulator, maltose regulon positive regulatory protein
MTMTYSLHDGIDPDGACEHVDVNRHYSQSPNRSVREGFHFIRDKLEIPAARNVIARPRIDGLLNRSVQQFPATLISGRAGTGKTTIAAAFAAARGNASWYSVESSDKEWQIFCRYFKLFISAQDLDPVPVPIGDDETFREPDVARFLVDGLAGSITSEGPGRLLVMDDIHHIFDAQWFDDFFKLLLYSLPVDTHLLMLCRSKPPSPLWRLRSKQMLNVLDEKVIAFTESETEKLLVNYGFSPAAAHDAHQSCYGRVSKLLQLTGRSD